MEGGWEGGRGRFGVHFHPSQISAPTGVQLRITQSLTWKGSQGGSENWYQPDFVIAGEKTRSGEHPGGTINST